MLSAYLKLLKQLERSKADNDDDDEVGRVMTEILEPLRKRANAILNTQALGNSSFRDLSHLHEEHKTLKLLERDLFTPALHKAGWSESIESWIKSWRDSFEKLKLELPFLNAYSGT